MKLLLQRVSEAAVSVDGREVARIGPGLLIFVGIEHGDGPAEVARAAEKVSTLRVFPDADGRMNRDVREAGGGILVVSQFTLAGSIRKGRRPSFDGAALPDLARPLVERLAATLREAGLQVGEGVFGAHMHVSLVNDGPVTFLHDIPPAAGRSAPPNDASD